MATMIHFVSFALGWFAHSFRDPAWVAAYALTVQIGIFAWQGWILRRHAKTLETHVGIADKQEKTATLINAALDQQKLILINQFNFQKQLQAESERRIVFDLIVKLLASVHNLTARLAITTYSRAGEVEAITEAWVGMDNDVTSSRMALLDCEHLGLDEKAYLIDYVMDVSQLKQTNAANQADYIQLKNLNEKYKDFWATLIKNRKTAIV